MLERRFGLTAGIAAVMTFACAAPFCVFAASLGFSPAAKTVSVGQTFPVDVVISSPDQAMNAASGDVSFPADKLQVVSIGKSNSVMDLWVRNPSFSNSATGGDVNFEGVVLNPGYTGSDGIVLQIVFEATSVGDAPISFATGSVLANDGNGTEILDSLGTADFTVVPAAAASSTASSTASSSVSSTAPLTISSSAVSTAPTVVVQYELLPAWLMALLLFVAGLIGALISYGFTHHSHHNRHSRDD